MKIKILMKSGNVYIGELDKAKNIIEAYELLHLNQNKCVVIGDDAIINPLEVAEVIAIDDDNKILKKLSSEEHRNEIVINDVKAVTDVKAEDLAKAIMKNFNKSSYR